MEMARFFTLTSILLLTSTLAFAAVSADETENEKAEVQQQEHAVLVFTKTEGWRHASIEPGVKAVKQLGEENNFGVTWTEDPYSFKLENLSRYDAVIFLNTTLDVLDDPEQNEFEQYIQNGGGFVGIHSAADTEYEWPWYGDLVGGWFNSHPNDPNVRDATVIVVDDSHPATVHLPENWDRADEWYNFKYFYDATNKLLKMDTDSYEGSEHPGNHPVSWYHEYDGGRAFYTALGHTSESFSEDLYLQHILGGIQYAMGISE